MFFATIAAHFIVASINVAKLNNKRRPIVIGNWKLHGDTDFVGDLLGEIVSCWVGVHKAEVVEKREDILTVKYGSIARNVFATLVPDAKVGDKVTVHWAFAIEKVD